MNTLFVLLDGAEDDPVPEFGGKKPLDVAKMPFMASKAPNRAYTTGRGYTHLFLNEFFTHLILHLIIIYFNYLYT